MHRICPLALSPLLQISHRNDDRGSKRRKAQQHLEILKSAVLANHQAIRNLRDIESKEESIATDYLKTSGDSVSKSSPISAPLELSAQDTGPQLCLPSRPNPSNAYSKPHLSISIAEKA